MKSEKKCGWIECNNLTTRRFCRQACREKFQYADPVWRAKKLARNTAYNKSHPEVNARAQKNWYENGGAEVRKRWREENWDRQLELMRRWKKTDKGRAANTVNGSRRRARILSANGNYTPNEWKSLCDQYGGLCIKCGKPEQTADHVIPLSVGGSNSIDNIQPLCKSCNSAKGTTTADYR